VKDSVSDVLTTALLEFDDPAPEWVPVDAFDQARLGPKGRRGLVNLLATSTKSLLRAVKMVAQTARARCGLA
jgi:hypothetical protein